MTTVSALDAITRPVSPDAVHRAARRCIVREQVDDYLVYNADTDEMHLLPPLGMHAYLLCDGSRTAEEVAILLADAMGLACDESVAERVCAFLGALVTRRVLEPVPPPAAQPHRPC